jgi:hypothetical protein
VCGVLISNRRGQRLGTSREGGNLLMPDMQPFDLSLAAYDIGEAVEAVTDDTVDALDACERKGLSELVCDAFMILVPVSAEQ